MNNRQVDFIKAQIADIDYLLEKADKGYEVGDILKLDAKKEQLENKLNKLLGKEAVEEVVDFSKAEEDSKDDMTAMELYSIRHRVEELEEARKSKRNKVLWVALFIWMTIVAVIGVYNSNKVNMEEAKDFKEKAELLDKQNYCYRVLYNEDEIGNGCEEVFKEDEWYKEYKLDVERYEESR